MNHLNELLKASVCARVYVYTFFNTLHSFDIFMLFAQIFMCRLIPLIYRFVQRQRSAVVIVFLDAKHN